MRTLSIAIIFSFVCTTCYSQSGQKIIDSLKYQLTIARQDTNRVIILTSLCNMYRQVNTDSSKLFGEAAIQLARQINFPTGEVNALQSLSAVLRIQGDIPNSLKYRLEALKVLEEKLPNMDKTNIWVGIGLIYLDINDYAKAKYYFQKTISLGEKNSYGNALINIERAYTKNNQLDSAWYFAQKAYDYTKTPDASPIYSALVMDMGIIQYKIGNRSLAFSYLHKSISECLIAKDHRTVSDAYSTLSEFYKETNQPDSCLFYAQKGLIEGQSIRYQKGILNNATLLAELYETRDIQKSLSFYKIAKAASDELYGVKKVQALQKIIADEQERQRNIETDRIRNQNQLKQYALLFGLGIMFLIGFILYRNNSQKQKVNTVLQNTLTELKTAQTELENKNREAHIEVALERVRSRTMAMQRSDELAEASLLLDSEVRGLGIKTRGCGFNIYGENESTEWFSSELGTMPTYKTTREHFFLTYFEAGQRGETLLIQEFAGEECVKHYDYLCSLPVTGEGLRQFKASGGSFPTHQIDHVAYFKYGYLLFITIESVPEAHDIFKRFAKVFEQTYTRFLDLQKAEAQAREAQIQLSLERVRSRAMAMHHSNELFDLLTVLIDQFDVLGICPKYAHISIIDPATNSFTFRISGPVGKRMLAEQVVDMDASPVWKASIDNWKKGENYSIGAHRFPKEILPQTLELFAGVLAQIPEELRFTIDDFPDGAYITEASCKFGFLGYGHTRESTQDEKDIVVRFVKEFERSYQRFLDLQKAEAQAREAQIELSLEKVRSRSMAMHQSNELAAVASVLFQQIKDLGFEMWSCGFCIWKPDNFSELWMSADSGGLLPPMMMPYKEEPTHHKIYEDSLRGQPTHEYIWEGEELLKHYEFLNTIPSVKEAIDILKKSGLSLPLRQCYYVGYFKQGYLLIITKEPTNEMKDLSYRFSKVFEQAYIRFLDLQKAETLAEQAQLDLIQIQTEKKRAETALSILKATQNQLIQSEKLASLGELTAGIAHEIQNPLNFVNNFSELNVDLVKDIKDEMHKPDIDKVYLEDLLKDLTANEKNINHHGKRAASIVSGMLEHSRASTGKKEWTDVNKLADEYFRLSYHGFRAKNKDFNAEMITDFDTTIPKIEIIPQNVGRVILNLINNAFYAVNQKQIAVANQLSESLELSESSYSPTVTVSTTKTDNAIEIKVKDNGTGMPENVRAKVFQPFFTTKPTGQGTGFGLSLAYDIITKGHGGELKVESTEGVGSEFIIQLKITN